MTLHQRALLCASALLLAGAAQAQTPVRIASLVELSGAGVNAGTSFKNGVELAVKEINAAGGILGAPIENTVMDTQSNPGVAKAMALKAVSQDVFAVFGPVFSGSVVVSMTETQRAETPQFTGGEAASITQTGNPYIFRTSFTQANSMPKVALYIADKTRIRRLAVIYVDNDFGRGGLEMLRKALVPSPVRVVVEVPTEPAQIDFSAAVVKAKQSEADAVFVYCNEEESARALRELRKQAWAKPIIGESTLVGQKVIELAGGAANGVIAHVGLTSDAPVAAIRGFRTRFESEYKATPDHNAMKGYSGVYVLKAAVERTGRLDRKTVAKTMKGLKVNTDRYPGALMYTEYDQKGDLDRMSFMVEVRAGKQEVVDFLAPLALSQSWRPPPKAMLAAPSAAAAPAPPARRTSRPASGPASSAG